MTLLLAAALGLAADAPHYLMAPISTLKFDKPLPELSANSWPNDPAVVVDGRGTMRRWNLEDPGVPVRADLPNAEAEILFGTAEVPQAPKDWSQVFLIVKAAKPGAAAGTMRFMLTQRGRDAGVETRSFTLPATAGTTRADAWFALARARRLEDLRFSSAVGPVAAAWLRREIASPALAAKETVLKAGAFEPEAHEPRPGSITLHGEVPGNAWRRRRLGDDPLAFLSGGQAFEENLQLDRPIVERPNAAPAKEPEVPLKDLPGIDIAALDWKAQLKGKNPALDPLAALVPHDQHAAFFATPTALAATLEEIETTGFGMLRATAENAADEGVGHALREQLGVLDLQWLALLPTTLATSIAITGSDLNFATGTDVAALIASPEPEGLAAFVLAAWATTKVAPREERIAGLPCAVLRTPDRRRSAYLAVLPNAVLLTNSPAQVSALAGVLAGKTKALASLDEYKFFRDRYPRGAAAETGFVILTDDAIRRWCGPRWRIAQSRRIATRNLLAAAQAEWFDSLLRNAPPPAAKAPGNGPRIEFGEHGAWSAEHGSARFQTPIAELAFDTASKAEADAYRQWREGYQRNWAGVFDPIAISFSVAPERLATDVSVMPLIVGSEYRRDLFFASAAPLPPGAGDPHPEAVAQFVAGLDPKRLAESPRGNWLDRPLGPENAVSSWLGHWITLYADDDPFWQDPLWRDMQKENWLQTQFARNLHRLPVGLAVGVKSPFALAAFLTAIKRSVETAAPNLVAFQARKHREIGYTAIVGENLPLDIGNLTLFYLPLPDQLLVTFHEPLLHRAINRHLARKAGTAPPPKEWLGNTFAAEGSAGALRMLQALGRDELLPRLQRTAWANAALLEEWRRRRPDVIVEILLDLHMRGAGERLLCPAGGKFVLTDGGIASTALGMPFAPKGDLSTSEALLTRVERIAGGFTLAEDNLRAKVELRRTPAK